MNSLLDEIAQSLGLRRSNSQTKPAEIQVQLVDIQGRMADFEHRLARMEAAFNEFVVAFQRKLSDLARRGAQARRQAVDELEVLRRDLDTYIDILEKSVEGRVSRAPRELCA